MYVKTMLWSQTDPEAFSIRCPHCRQQSALEAGAKDISIGDRHRVGHRRCADPECRQHVFIVYRTSSASPGADPELLATYPAERLDFDASNLPDRVREALEEAVACHAAEAYSAAGMMVRKTLELLCEDRKAEGGTLYERIESLRDKVVIPQELLEGMHDLRLLGNDAAHVESRVYNQVGKEEVEIAMDVAKEVLKSVYQLSGLLDRLRGLKRQDS